MQDNAASLARKNGLPTSGLGQRNGPGGEDFHQFTYWEIREYIYIHQRNRFDELCYVHTFSTKWAEAIKKSRKHGRSE